MTHCKYDHGDLCSTNTNVDDVFLFAHAFKGMRKIQIFLSFLENRKELLMFYYFVQLSVMQSYF